MGASSRRKGVTGEREVRAIWQAAGHAVRGLEGAGDHLVITPGGVTLHSEVKRQERCQLPMWLRQAELDTPSGIVPIVAWRPSRRDWYATLPLADLAVMLGAPRA